MIDQIATALPSGFDPAHALIVRPIDGGWQILSGHHRAAAARQVGLETVPCWVRPLDDAAAYMLLATSNAQGELSALERGMHALRSGMDIERYAEKVGRKRGTVRNEVYAAKVASAVSDIGHDLADHFSQLVEIHAAPPWLWPSLVRAMLAKGWTVEQTRGQVARFKDLPADAPAWMEETVADDLVEGSFPPRDIGRIAALIEKSVAELTDLAQEITSLGAQIPGELPHVCPRLEIEPGSISSYPQALALCDAAIGSAKRIVAEMERMIGNARAKASRLLEFVSLDEWKELDSATISALLPPDPGTVSKHSFNKQESDAIEWAQWSWNPVQGCLHDCPYCYARDLALGRAASAYPNGFAPTLRPSMLLAPRNTNVPKGADADTRFQNVFACSMADLFGRWVPAEWIEAVFSAMRAAAQWNFLTLTKFPKRLVEFDVPENAWMGTTVDLQARVAAAEAGFEKIGAKIKWLSCEPLIEPLRFNHLDRFDWIVIGGASRSSKSPEWRPPFEWISDLVRQAREAGLKVYFKTNLGVSNRILELPFDAPIKADPNEAPAIFHYLGKQP